MFKLILHHQYKTPGHAIDASGYRNHGHPDQVDFSSDGTASDSGQYKFDGQSSRVHVPLKPEWQDPKALRIEATVRINQVVERQNLVEGFMSFALFVRADGVITGAFLGLEDDESSTPHDASDTFTASVVSGGSMDPFTTLTDDTPPPLPPGKKLGWIGVNSDVDFSPDGVRRTMPTDRWVKVTFIHNGTGLWLYLNGQLVGSRTDITSPVLSVQPGGVHIGAWPTSDKFVLDGALDELKIWIYDPDYRKRKFFCQPMEKQHEICWRLLIGRMGELLKDPAQGGQLIEVLDCLAEAENDLLRAVYGQGTTAIEASRRFSRKYDRLWCAGAISSPAMQELLEEWGSWMQQIAGDAMREYQKRILDCQAKIRELCLQEDLNRLAHCDPAFGEFLQLVQTSIPAQRCPPRPKPDDPSECDERPVKKPCCEERPVDSTPCDDDTQPPPPTSREECDEKRSRGEIRPSGWQTPYGKREGSETRRDLRS